MPAPIERERTIDVYAMGRRLPTMHEQMVRAMVLVRPTMFRFIRQLGTVPQRLCRSLLVEEATFEAGKIFSEFWH